MTNKLPSSAEARHWWWVREPRQRFLAYYRCLREQHGLTASQALFLAHQVLRRYPDLLIQPRNLARKALGLHAEPISV